jgi:predicted acyl esterase
MSIDKSWPGYAKGEVPDDGFEWIWQEALPADAPNRDPSTVYVPFGYEKQILPKGYQKTPANKPLDLDIIFEKDVEIVLRDGVRIYVDIYRPADTNDKKIPIIMPYSPYGKGGGGANLMDVVPYRVGVPKSRQSGLEKFEGPDPNEWCQRGYAILDPNARGSFDSEGNLHCWGRKEGQDCYDIIEHAALYTWCNGSVGMAGNSWLGAVQYWAAMEQPPHLKAIAPWEGFSDLYRDMTRRGGIPWPPFIKWVLLGVPGRGLQEAVTEMSDAHEFYDKYWESKSVDFSKIKVPSYILGSYSTMLHTMGAVRAWKDTKTDKKWLRFHPHQEWYEDYHYRSVDDLDRFFARYLKEEENGWESTPKVRISMYRFGDRVSSYSSNSFFISGPLLISLKHIVSPCMTKLRQIIPFHAPNIPSYILPTTVLWPTLQVPHQQSTSTIRPPETWSPTTTFSENARRSPDSPSSRSSSLAKTTMTSTSM